MAYLSVTQINQIIKTDLELDESLKSVQVMGEISNFKNHSSGHFYFTLKDAESRINCVMFSTYASKIRFKLEDGMKIMASCSVGVYVSSGSYQLYVYNIEPIGLGTLYLQYEQLKKKLESEGLFDSTHKKQLPSYPTNIGVISAKEGAAIQDVITTIKRRWPIAQITLIPSLVQGRSATNDLINKLTYADSLDFEVIIVARGGGSIEDLWCFNEEEVARTVFNMNTPLISAVGHETDFTIIDFVSDCRAPTPTAAAEISTPNIIDLHNKLNNIESRIINAFKTLINESRIKLDHLKTNKHLTNAETIFADKLMKVNLLNQRLINANKEIIYYVTRSITEYKTRLLSSYKELKKDKKTSLLQLIVKLDSLSPLKTMNRGYGIIEGINGIITSIHDTNISENITIKLVDGQLNAKVLDKKEK